MQNQSATFCQTPVQARNRSWTTFALALSAALAVHAMLLLIPLVRQTPVAPAEPKSVKVSLTSAVAQPAVHDPPPPQVDATLEPETQAPPEKPQLAVPQPIESLAEERPASDASLAETMDKKKGSQTRIIGYSSLLAKLNSMEDIESKKVTTGFQYPVRQNMDTMLNPAPTKFPFAAPQLVIASYDSGVLGGMQRMRDAVIFKAGWTTKNGARMECATLLIIPIGCGWGRATDFQPARHKKLE